MLFGVCKAQYVAHWTPTGAKIDSVQQSMDGNSWKTLNIVFGGLDTSLVPGPTYFYRISGNNGIKTNSVLVTSALPVTVSNLTMLPVGDSIKVSWTSSNEQGGYYLISTSLDGVNYSIADMVPEKGNGTYSKMIKR